VAAAQALLYLHRDAYRVRRVRGVAAGDPGDVRLELAGTREDVVRAHPYAHSALVVLDGYRVQAEAIDDLDLVPGA
jgi:hypothetical protein